jgi:hypothetical protein
MKKTLLPVLASVATVALSGPALAAESTVDVSDPCGDNRAYVYYNDFRQDIPPTNRTPRFDLKGVVVAPVTGGVAVRITTCEAPGAPDGLKGWRSLYVTTPDGCQLAIGAEEPALPLQERRPYINKTCWDGPDKMPTPFAEDTSYEVFDIDLGADALTVAGDTLTVTVKRAGLTGDAAATFAAGTVWQHLRVLSTENTNLWGGGGDSEGNSWGEVVPTGHDWASTASPFTVS